MEKIININFQGRVIAIEETAYNTLRQYVDSLRAHFANEESSDEIIGDIENRIAELLSERLKHGASCIGINDLNAVIDSIGRIEDIEAAEGEDAKAGQDNTARADEGNALKGRFFRNADDKVIAGVCSGIAVRTGIDPLVVRILFVLLMGALFWIYILLWVIVPSQSISSHITRRLYRNPENKMIAGVCSGLAAYFRIDTWIPRVVFALPLFIGLVTQGIHTFWWSWPTGLGNRIFVGSMGSTFLILYIVLWIALPYASSATDKMEMRGEKIDINSITTASKANAASPQRPAGTGLGRVIGIVFKAFFLFIAGTMALSLFGVLIGLVSMSFITFPLMDFLLDGWNQNFLVWAGIILFLGIPMLALITWIVRRLIGARSHRHYLGYVFSGLWIIGLVSILCFTGIIARNFNSKSVIDETYSMVQPHGNTLYFNEVNFTGGNSWIAHRRNYTWFNDWDDDNDNTAPFYLVNKDSLWLRSVRLNVMQSSDSFYHIYESKSSYGPSSYDAKVLAGHIVYTINQEDSIVNLPAGFTVSSADKFRNQQVAITVEVPVGKEVQFSKEMHTHFDINTGGSRHHRYHDHWSHTYRMTASGLERNVDTSDED